MDSDLCLNAPKTKKYREGLENMRAASAASHESVLRLINAQEELQRILADNPEMKIFACIEALLNENARLKEKESIEYVKDLEEENALLRDLQGMSPISRIRPPLPKPNPYAFWDKGRDVVALQIDMSKQKQAIDTIEDVMQNSPLSPKSSRLLSRAKTVIDTARRNNANKIDEYHSYIASYKRKRLIDED